MASKKIYKFTGFDKVIFNGVELNPIPATIDDCSWEEILSMVRDGTFADYYSVGDIKNVKLKSGETMQMILASINDGTNSPGRTNGRFYPAKTIDFISKNGTSNVSNLTQWVNNVLDEMIPWTDSSARNTLNTTIYNQLPDDIKALIIEKDHYYDGYEFDKSYSVNRIKYYRSSDKIWLPTAYELGLSSSLATQNPYNYNKTYPIFSSSSDRQKYYNKRCTSSLNDIYSGNNSKYYNYGISELGDFTSISNHDKKSTIIGFRIG